MKRLIDEDQVFAIVSGLTAGAEDGVALTQEKRSCSSVRPPCCRRRRTPLNRYIFYFLPGLKEQARALVSLCGKKTDALEVARGDCLA